MKTKKYHKETLMIIFISLFGALIASALNLLLSDINNWISWVGFSIVIIIIYYVAYKILKFSKFIGDDSNGKQ